ncbi:MAG: hypothetical protein RBR35_14320 [Salinivirgaceae bacterium]|nr:hypothetical protein [Salinivirgaceae bacterium]
MKKEYRLAIEKLFFAELKRIDPGFERVKVKAICKYDGEAVSVKSVGTVKLFISVIPNPKGHEEFAVEIGWSKRNEFPDLNMRPSIFSIEDNTEFDTDDGMIRLTSFSRQNQFGWKFQGIDYESDVKYFSGTDALRTTPKEIIEQDLKRKPTKDEATVAVRPAVKSAIDDLKKFGLPYLEKFLTTV